MDLSYSPEEQAFRNEVRSWLAANLPDDIRQKVTGYQGLSKDDFICTSHPRRRPVQARSLPRRQLHFHSALV